MSVILQNPDTGKISEVIYPIESMERRNGKYLSLSDMFCLGPYSHIDKITGSESTTLRDTTLEYLKCDMLREVVKLTNFLIKKGIPKDYLEIVDVGSTVVGTSGIVWVIDKNLPLNDKYGNQLTICKSKYDDRVLFHYDDVKINTFYRFYYTMRKEIHADTFLLYHVYDDENPIWFTYSGTLDYNLIYSLNSSDYQMYHDYKWVKFIDDDITSYPKEERNWYIDQQHREFLRCYHKRVFNYVEEELPF